MQSIYIDSNVLDDAENIKKQYYYTNVSLDVNIETRL